MTELSKNFNTRIVDILKSNKKSIKTYLSYERAAEEAQKVSDGSAKYYGTSEGVEFIVAFVPSTNRFTPVFLFANFIRQHDVGGYAGFIATKGFMAV